MPVYKPGDSVTWNVGSSHTKGTVKEVYTTPVSRDDVGGNPKKRNASEDNPAYLVLHEDGTQFLKSETELYQPRY